MGSGPCSVFFFNDTATTEIYTLSLHDALPIFRRAKGRRCKRRREGQRHRDRRGGGRGLRPRQGCGGDGRHTPERSEEHTSELQSRQYLVCRLLLEKKKNRTTHCMTTTLLCSSR